MQSIPSAAIADAGSPKTIVFNKGAVSSPKMDAGASAEPQLLMSVAFGNKNELSIGRDDSNIANNRWLSGALWGKGIGNALREWDGWAHDWPWWYQMIKLYIGGHD